MSPFPPTILCKISTVSDGNMSFRFSETPDVIKNRGQFLEQHSIPYDKHICMACNNGETILTVTSKSPGVGVLTASGMPEAEVLITSETNLALMLLTADCIPASFYDPVKNVIALAHLNRHTIGRRLAQKTVGYLDERYGTKAAYLRIHFGPYIHTDSYRFPVPLDTEPAPELTDFVIKKNDAVSIDLKSAFIHQLTKAGVPKTNIYISDSNTATSDRYFSHYRHERDLSCPRGRMATILMMR